MVTSETKAIGMNIDKMHEYLFVALLISIVVNVLIFEAYKSFKTIIFRERLDEFKRLHSDIKI